MKPTETRQQKIARVADEVGAGMHSRLGSKWDTVRIARRNRGDQHVWRIRTGSDEPDRYLHLPHRSMTAGDNPTATLLGQLDQGRWLERMESGPETAFRLTPGGQLRARPVE